MPEEQLHLDLGIPEPIQDRLPINGTHNEPWLQIDPAPLISSDGRSLWAALPVELLIDQFAVQRGPFRWDVIDLRGAMPLVVPRTPLAIETADGLGVVSVDMLLIITT